MKKNTAWLLAVVSDVGQTESLPYQKKWLVDTCAANSWTVTREFAKAGSSGKEGVRALVETMLAALRATPANSRPERILMIRQDRLGRGSGIETMGALAEIYELGTVVHTREDGDIKLSRVADSILPFFRAMTAGLENETKIDKAVATYARKRRAKTLDTRVAVSNVAPYGLTFEKGLIVASEPAASTVRMAFEMRVAGAGCYAIAKALRGAAPPRVLRDGTTRDMVWDGNFVSRMLKKHIYVDSGLIDESLFQRAQRNDVLQSGRAPRTHLWPLTGALRCECGVSLMGLSNAKRGYFWYACRDTKRVHGALKTHRKDDIEAQWAALLTMLRTVPAMIDAVQHRGRDDAEQRKMLMKQLSSLRSEGSRLAVSEKRIWQAFDAGDVPSATLQGRLDSLKADETENASAIAEAENELNALNARHANAEEARSVVESTEARWSKANYEEKKSMAKRIAAVFGGSLIVSHDGTLEKDLLGNIALAKIVVRNRLRK